MTPPLRILLLQARDPGDPARRHEHTAFAQKLGRDEEQLTPYDLLQGPPGPSDMAGIDALMVGGSGDYFVSKGNLPHAHAFGDFLAEVAARGFPTFASCFGFQCLVQALGGEVAHDPAHTEVGAFEIALNEAGRRDPLLGGLPETFRAQLGRKDRATRLPAGVTGLASSAACPYQALRVNGQPIWATQFHPELDMADNRRRYELYLEAYSSGTTPGERAAGRARFQPSTPGVSELLPRFVDLVFG